MNARRCPRRRAARGASLVELMVGLAIGLFVTAGVIAAYGNAGRSNRINDAVAVAQETARALGQLMARDVMAAGFYGLAPGSTQIEGRRAGASPIATAAIDDCGDRWYADLDRALEGYNDANPFGASCIPAPFYRAGTDVLAVRYVDDAVLDPPAPGTLVVRSHRSAGALFLADGGAGPDLGAAAEDRALQARAYWIGAPAGGVPALRMRELGLLDGKPRLLDLELARGVEDLQLEFGVDLDDDGVIDGFRTANQVDPWNSGQVMAVKLWLLIRGESAQPAFENKTYEYAGKSFVSADRQYRYLYTTTIARRNRG